MIRVCDYITNFIREELGVDTVYMVSGGGMMFLSDGLIQRNDMRVICNHHEQASAMAAAAYARQKNSFGAAMFTTGCGATNAITGLLGAYQDSVPVVYFSGQAKRKDCTHNSPLPLRQLGVQEADIVEIVRPLTKYAVVVNDPASIKYHLEKAKFLAASGRPGPVWIDLPLDVQGALVDPDELSGFLPDQSEDMPKASTDDVAYVYEQLAEASRPVIVGGNGVRLAGAEPLLKQLLERHNVPMVSPYLGRDLIPTDHPLNIGAIGAKGSRAGNFAMQNADFLLVLGSRLDISAIGYEGSAFARQANIIIVDIDPVEHQKGTIEIDKFIHSDAKAFLDKALKESDLERAFDDWAAVCANWKKKWPVCLPEYFQDDSQGVNMYAAVDRITRLMPENATVVSDAGSAFYITSQAGNFNHEQRYVTSGAQAEMGYTVPACIGVESAKSGEMTVGITGDGSLQMNLQELATINHNRQNIKLFVLNNYGYLSIRATQNKFFEGRFVGVDSDSGLFFPSTEKICHAYDIPYYKVDRLDQLDATLEEIYSVPGPALCEIMCIKDQPVIPCLMTVKNEDGSLVSRPLEDMFPFLPRDEFAEEMIVSPI